jgi:hypothetical protein
VRRLLLLLVLGLTTAAHAFAHAPGTAIGRATEALGAGSVSYDPGASLSELDAQAVERRLQASHGIAVALMPATALTEVPGGPDSVAAEIARESGVHGTVIVLAGRQLGAWSDAVGPGRIDELVRATSANGQGAVLQAVLDLIGRVEAEQPAQTHDGSFSVPSWAVAIAAGLLIVALATGVMRFRSRSSSSESSADG